jgi:hypothetical protein
LTAADCIVPLRDRRDQIIRLESTVAAPCHTKGGLPAGLMIAGPAMTDHAILAIARAVEKALQTA